MTRPVLFIDIDGVAHPQGASWVTPLGKLDGDRLFRWAPQLVQLLKELPNVDVVVHSSWRLLFETDDEVRAFMPSALAARVVACTPRDVVDRHESILEYVKREGVARYAIVDDEPKWFPMGLPGLIVCSPKTGLSRRAKVSAVREALEELPRGPSPTASMEKAPGLPSTPPSPLIQDMIHREDLLDLATFATRLGWTQQTLSKAVRANRVLLIDLANEKYIPAFYADSKYDRHDLADVTKALGDVPGTAKLLWFIGRKGSLGGLTPLEAISRGQVAKVRDTAAAFRDG